MSLFNKQLQLNVQEDISPLNITLELDRLYAALNTYISETKSWNPTYSAGGAMTWTTVTTENARYIQIGKWIIGHISAVGTTGGVASANVRFTLPIPPKYTADNIVSGGCFITDGGPRNGLFAYNNASGTIIVQRYDGANWGLGAGREIGVDFQYEIE